MTPTKMLFSGLLLASMSLSGIVMHNLYVANSIIAADRAVIADKSSEVDELRVVRGKYAAQTLAMYGLLVRQNEEIARLKFVHGA